MNVFHVMMMLLVMVGHVIVLLSGFSEESLKDFEKLPHSHLWRNKKYSENKRFSLDHTTDGLFQNHSHFLTTTTIQPETQDNERQNVNGRKKIGKGRKNRNGHISVAEAKERIEAKRKRKKSDDNNNNNKKESKQRHRLHRRNDSSTILDEKQQASLHLKIMSSAKCSIPSKKLIQIHDYYPVANLLYLPHCTWIHRCTDDFGCCSDLSKTCSPIAVNNVTLYFFTKSVGETSEGKIMGLQFENHTECDCMDRNSQTMPRTEEMIYGSRMDRYRDRFGSLSSLNWFRNESKTRLPSTDSIHPSTKPLTRIPHNFFNFTAYFHTNRNQTLTRCRCPSEFSPIADTTSSGNCFCDCLTNQKSCLRLKRGKETFFLRDRGCINNGSCKRPKCQYGNYVKILGRCPKRQEKGAHWLIHLP